MSESRTMIDRRDKREHASSDDTERIPTPELEEVVTRIRSRNQEATTGEKAVEIETVKQA
jgi:hypothetical protein